MMIKNLFYCLAILLGLKTFLVAMEKQDHSGEHSEVLMEDLVNFTDTDLEFKDSDQLELLLSKIDTSLKDPQNDFEGQFNVPEITCHDGWDPSVDYSSKIVALERLKARVVALLNTRNVELGPREE